MESSNVGVAPGRIGERSGDLEVFSRRSSGLVRELSLADAAWYGILAAAALFGLLYVFPIPQGTLPGLSVPLSALLAMVVMVPVYVLYAGLGSAMPRMGGDYLYQSRAIHPAVGFTFTFAWEVFMWVTFTTTGGLVVSTLALQPLLYHLGVEWSSAALIDASNWFGGGDGLLVTTLVLAAAAFLTTIVGIGVYRKVQRAIIVPAILISNLVLIVLLLRSHGSFLSNFDAFHSEALGQVGMADKVRAAAGGYDPPGFSLKNTILFISVTGLIWYVVFGAQGLLGEIKQAGSFSKLLKAFMLGGLYVGIVAWVLPTWLFQQAMGRDFMAEYAFAVGEGKIEAPGGATVTNLAMMMTGSPVVLILLSLGFLAVGYYFATCVFLNMTRVLSAMGMDRTLPGWFATVSERFHAPVNAALFYLVVAVGLNVLYRVNDDIRNTMLFGGAFTSVGVIAVTGLAGVLFAWRAKPAHDTSPIARHRLFGLPLIAVAGGATFLAAGTVTVLNLILPELGFTTGWARTLLLVSLLVSALWFFAWRAYQRHVNGVDIDLAFKQVPPE